MAPIHADATQSRRDFTAVDLGLYAGTVVVWGTTWIALKYQVGEVDPQVSILWRFLLAAPILFAICRVAAEPLGFPAATHLRFAALGLFLFSTNFNLFYHAGAYVVSGLLAVIFSLSSITNILLAAGLLAEPLRPRVALGALAGLGGVAVMFWPEMAGGFGRGATVGLALGILGCLSFSTGNMISARLGRSGVPGAFGNCLGRGLWRLVQPRFRSGRRQRVHDRADATLPAQPAVARAPRLRSGVLDVPGAAAADRPRPRRLHDRSFAGAGAGRLYLR
jgi:drug/metabolite transporter (DMT)-like permease